MSKNFPQNILNNILNEDCIAGMEAIPDNFIDLIIADPPYGLDKDFGNDSDRVKGEEYLEFSRKWTDVAVRKLKENGSFYIFLTWQYTPEVFSLLKKSLIMLNEIIWDRRVPSMGGSTRRYSSVHDNIGFFTKGKKHYFDIDSIRIPYDPETKKARTRSIFIGKPWLEKGYNPKDIWVNSRIHRQDPEREDHPTQKPLLIIERMIKASCPPNGIVLDPFMGTGTTAVASIVNKRNFVGFEINPKYHSMSLKRLKRVSVDLLRNPNAFLKSGSFAQNLGIRLSMSHKGSPWENGYQESFYGQFKIDLGDPNRYKSLGELAAAIYQEIHYYNTQRIHSKLKMPPRLYAERHQLTTNQLSIKL